MMGLVVQSEMSFNHLGKIIFFTAMSLVAVWAVNLTKEINV